MGLLTFFSRKGGGRRKASISLTSQRHESTIDTLSTQVDNVPEDLHPLPMGPSDLSQIDLAFEAASVDDLVAPAPAVPLFRNEDIERPSTAPNSRPASISFANGGSRLKRDGKKRPPPLSYRMPQPGTTASGSRPSSRGSEKTVTGVLSRPFSRSRASSLQSDGGKGFKDLLDAQSEFNPVDFRTRVKANGARDYGEDVAERNMGENGVELESVHVRAFYAQPPKVIQADDNNAVSEMGSMTDIRGASSRKSLPSLKNSMSSYRFPDRSLPLALNPTGHKPFGQSRSVSSFKPRNRSVSAIDRSSVKLGENLPQLPTPELAKQVPSLPALELSLSVVPQRPRTSTGTPVRARRHRDSVMLAKKKAEATASEETDGDEVPAKALPPWSAAHHQRISSLRSAHSVPRTHSLHTLKPSVSSSISSRDADVNATLLLPPRTSSLPQQVHARTTSTDPLPVDHTPLANPQSPAPVPAPETHQSSKIREEEEIEILRPPSRSAPLAPTTAGDNIANNLPDEVYEDATPYQPRDLRAWSVSSGTPTATDSITSHPFHHAASLHTADTSIDLTFSAVSLLLKPAISSPASLKLHNNNPPSENDEDDEDETPSPHKIESINHPDTHTDNFNIYDYVSSDNDSFITTPNRRPTAEGEEDLLFDDKVFLGPAGLQLPGLADPFPTSSSLTSAKRRRVELLKGARSSPSIDGGVGMFMNDFGYHGDGDEGSSGGGYFDMVSWGIGRRRGSALRKRGNGKRREKNKRFVLNTAADDEESGYSAEEEGELQVLDLVGSGCGNEGVGMEGRESTLRCRRNRRTKRLSALCRAEGQGNGDQQQEKQEEQGTEVVEEKRGNGVDVAAAVMLRKKVRRARRLAGQPSTARLRRTRSVNQRLGTGEAVPVAC